MRKVEEQLAQAIRECRAFSGGNTVYSPEAGTVTLHGNLIARISLIHPERSFFSWAGWGTPTTRSRLNACWLGLGMKGRFFIARFGPAFRREDNTEFLMASSVWYSADDLLEVSNA